MTRAWAKPAYFMSTKDKGILQYVLNRLYKELFPRGYEEWKTQSDFNKACEEISNDVLAGIPLDMDQFVTEMN